MGKILPLQNSFAAGEISPLAEMRRDLETINQGVALAENVYCRQQGVIEKRCGSQHVATISDERSRVYACPTHKFQQQVAVIASNKITFYDELGLMYKSTNTSTFPAVVFNFVGGNAYLKNSLSNGALVSFEDGGCVLHAGQEPYHYSQVNYQSEGYVAGDVIDIKIGIASGRGELHIRVVDDSTSSYGSVYFEGSFFGEEDIVIPSVTIAAGKDGIAIEIKHQTTEEYIEPKILSKIIMVVQSGTRASVPLEFSIPLIASGKTTRSQAKYFPEIDAFIMVGESYDPAVFEMDALAGKYNAITKRNHYDTPSQPGPTQIPYRPTTLEAFEGRLYYGKNSTLWGSSSRSYYDFYVSTGSSGTEPLPDDAIKHNITAQGVIQWLESQRNLLIGTSASEHIVTSKDGVIMPGDIKVTKQSGHGSATAAAAEIGGEVAFISSNRTDIRHIGYEWTQEAWVSKNLILLAEHLATKEGTIDQIHYAKSPVPMIICVSDKGSIYICVYNAEAKAGAWSRYTTDGKVLSMAVSSLGGNADIWMMVRRPASGWGMELERLSLFGRPHTKIYLDSYKYFRHETDTNTFTGLDHIKGQKAQLVKADGSIIESVNVNTSGVVTTSETITQDCWIGLPYDAKVQTLARDDGAVVNQRAGSSREKLKRWNKVYARTIDTPEAPIINGQTPSANQDPRYQGKNPNADVKTWQVPNRGWNIEAPITIEYKHPSNFILSGIFGEQEQED